MTKKSIISIYFILFVSALGFADQAAWIEKSAAYKAGAMLNPGQAVRKYCAPCGDSGWTELTVKQVEVKPAEDSSYKVLINGEDVDLAYLYIEKDGKWVDFAVLLGLKVADVPEFLPDSVSAKPQTEEFFHPIDNLLNDCLSKDSSTAGTNNCFNECYRLWDAELNKVFNQLNAMLSPNQQKALKSAQSEWIRYRDREFEFMKGFYGSFQGTMYGNLRAHDRAEFVKKRTLELTAYLELMKEMRNEK